VLTYLYLYLDAVLTDGDYANDWITHLPRCVRGFVQHIGVLLARTLERHPEALHAAARMVDDVATCGDPTMRGSDPIAAAHIAALLARLAHALLRWGYC
jgi:hypothetical protein